MPLRQPRLRSRLGSRDLQLEQRLAPAQLLPDLQILSSYLSGWSVNTTSTGGRELRFATALANGGLGAFEINATSTIVTNPDGSQSQLVNQKIFNTDGTYSLRPAGSFTYHPEHGHFHFDSMAVTQLRLRPGGTGVGAVIASGPKVSFCLLDSTRFNPGLANSPALAAYLTCTAGTQGISVGWADIYSAGLPGQSIDITGIPNGDYWLEVTADPLNAIQETDETNNTARIPITISTLPASGFRVLSGSPLGASADPVSFVTVKFNQSADAATFTTGDVSMTGPGGAIPVTAITQVDAATYRINFALQSTVGTYQLIIGPDISSSSGQKLDQNNNGIGGEAADSYVNIFTIPAPRFNSTSPAGGVIGPVNNLRVTFSKPISSSSFSLADVVSFSGPGGINLLSTITSITPAAPGGLSAVFDISFSGVTAPGLYQMVLAPTVVDAMGHGVDQNGDGRSDAADNYAANFAISPSGTAGPDSFGYVGTAIAPPAATIVGRAGTFTVHNNAEDAFALVNLGANAFNFYGINYAGNGKLWVSANGLITFGSGNGSPLNDNLSSALLPSIAVLWDDWSKGAGTPQVLGLFEDNNADGKPDRLIIEWNQVNHYGTTAGQSGVSFQAILELNTGARPGAIAANYLDVDTGNAAWNNGASATVGISAGAAGPRLLAAHDGSGSGVIQSGSALAFRVPRVESILRMDANPNNSGSAEFQVTFSDGVTGVDPGDFAIAVTGSIAGAVVDHIHATADPRVWEVHVTSYSGTGTLRLDLIDNDSITSTLGARLGGAGLNNGSFKSGESYTIGQPAPTVQAVNIGDGTAQRSLVKQVVVVFSGPVAFAGSPSNAFQLTGPMGNVSVSVDLSLSTATQTIARVTFTGPGTEFGSLLDGRYVLTILGSQISAGGVLLDGDGNGQPGGNAVINFFRLYGDWNGDARVDMVDFAAFRNAFTTGSSSGVFDLDGDGRVTITDYARFRANLYKTV